MSEAEQISREKVELVMEMCAEPMYLSEIRRKVNKNITGLSLTLSDVAKVAAAVADRDSVEIQERGYSGNNGQEVGSPHFGPDGEGGTEETKEWQPYTVIYNRDIDTDEIRQEVLDSIDLSLSMEDKLAAIDTLSGNGNSVSRDAEKILIDTMDRQFRSYATKSNGDYNDPGIDYFVSDDDQRDYALAIEVSVRSENPVDSPYVDAKQESAFDEDADLLILAPRFMGDVKDQYEMVDDDVWHNLPENEITHLHRVPMRVPEVYRPFAFSVPPEYERDKDGFPVIIPDSDRVVKILTENENVGERYPVVRGTRNAFLSALDDADREFTAITESGYRNQLREAVEPLLHEFERPYRIEQYLVETYWDRGLSQNEIGRLTGVSDRTISEWMSDRKWGVATRGTNTRLDDDTLRIWKRMYNGDSPFPREMTGYEIQALYNRFPEYDMTDWARWFSLGSQTRAEIMENRSSPQDKVSYTVMLNDGERIFPSYDFIINTLRREGVEIRQGFFGETGTVYPTGTALQFMLNRDIQTMGRKDEIGQRDVVEMRSDLEVQVAEWFSENKIPFAYEPFKIPSTYGGARDNAGKGGTVLDVAGDSDYLPEWRRIYDKHALSSSGSVDVDRGLDIYNKVEIVPDFALYPGADLVDHSADDSIWGKWSHLIEVAGAYGTPPPTDWLSWYRVSGVAYKELAYKALGLWEDTYFIVTDDEDIPQGVRNDPHYVIVSPTQLNVGLDGLENVLGLSGGGRQ